MSLKDCIDSAYQQGRITLEEATALKKRYDNLAKRILDPTRVKGQLLAELQAEAKQKERLALLTETARKRILAGLTEYKNLHGEMASALKFLIEHTGQARFMDVETQRKAILGEALSELDKLLFEFRKGWLLGHLRRGTGETRVRMENVIRELAHEKTNDKIAAGIAQAVEKVFESLRIRYNEAGGIIGKLERYILPQSHDQTALISVGEDKWVRYLLDNDMLDRNRMVHPLSGRPMTDSELEEALRIAYKRIVTDGWFDHDPSGNPFAHAALWKQHSDHRFIHFKNADMWFKYMKDFGGRADPFEVIMAHISIMARDIAAMEVLGPNPIVMLDYLRQVIMKDTAQQGGDLSAAKRHIKRAEVMWDHYRGTLNVPENPRFANVMSGLRNFVTSASLGSASLSALSDFASSAVTRAFVGMSRSRSSTFKVIYDVITHNAEDRTQAIRSGLILDEAMHGMWSQARYAGAINTRSITGFLADRTVNLSGLAALTQRVKHAFGLEFQGFMADMSGKAWDELPDAARRTLDRHGFIPDEWDKIRAVKKYEPAPGVFFLRPNEINATLGRELAEKYLRMILREMLYASPEATIRSTSLVLGETKPGTIIGELARSAFQFKSFSIAILMLHGARIASELQAGRRWTSASYAATMLIVGTMLGAVAMSLKDIAAGKDTRRWKDEETYKTAEFWGAALLQAGGLGIWGDFLFADLNRYGYGVTTTLAGPLAARFDQLRNLGPGNVKEILGGDKDTHAGREFVRFLRQNTPIIGTLWYLKLAYNRVLLDQLQEVLDKDAANAFRRSILKERRDYGREFWWPPGSMSPRAPELNVLRE